MSARSHSLLKLVAAILPIWFSVEAEAMTYRPVGDRQLVAQADLIVVGTVHSVAPVPGQEQEAVRYELEVTQSLKADLVSSSLAFQVPGAYDVAQDGALIVPGAPRFLPGESLLLFLHREADGSLGLTQLALGAFRFYPAETGEVLLGPGLVGLEPLDDTTQPERQREAKSFLAWLERSIASERVVENYWRELRPATAASSKFLLAADPSRWFEFEQGQAVTLLAAPIPQAGVAGGGYSDLQQAIESWNRAQGSLIRLVLGGMASPGGGLSRADGKNQVLFNDPHNEIPGRFDCEDGGIAAMTRWRNGASRTHQGRSYRVLVEADIVVQDGAGCLLSQSLNMAELLAHELGHALGLDHPCGEPGLIACSADGRLDEALMRPLMHADGRGAELGTDDHAGAAHLYGHSSVAAKTPADQSSSSGGGGALDGRLLTVLLALFYASASRLRHSARS